MAEFVHNHIRLHYEIVGQGIPVILLHGLGGSVDQIKNTFDPKEGLMMIMLDQQGHGESGADWETYNFVTLADDVMALADYLKIDTFYLCGISMGAAVSVNIATRYPHRLKGLFIIRSAWTDAPMEKQVVHIFKECAECLAHGGLERFQKTESYVYIRGVSKYTTDAFCGYFKDVADVKNYQKFQILPGLSPIESAAELKKIEVKSIILFNQSDLVHPAEYGMFYKQWIKNSEVYEIESKDSDPIAQRRAINEYMTLLIDMEIE